MRNQRMQAFLRLRHAAALVAVIVAFGVVTTTGGAVAASLITGRQIKNGTITTADVHDQTLGSIDLGDGSVTGADVGDGSLALSDLSADAQVALTGVPGDPGPAGPPGVSGYQVVHEDIPVPGGRAASVHATCPQPLHALSVQGRFADLRLDVEAVLRTNSGSITGSNTTTSSQDLFIDLVCADAAVVGVRSEAVR